MKSVRTTSFLNVVPIPLGSFWRLLKQSWTINSFLGCPDLGCRAVVTRSRWS